MYMRDVRSALLTRKSFVCEQDVTTCSEFMDRSYSLAYVFQSILHSYVCVWL